MPEDEQINISGEAIDYITSWLISDAEEYHDVLTSFQDMKNHHSLMEAIQNAIEAYNGGARNF